MATAENKTQPTDVSPRDFIAGISHAGRRADAETLLTWFEEVTGLSSRMWGPSIIGFGRYHYKYATGREGDFLMTGFSPRKASMVVYVLPGYRDMSELLAKLGKHRIGSSCLYINKLSDVDMEVLARIVTDGLAYMRENYDTWDT